MFLLGLIVGIVVAILAMYVILPSKMFLVSKSKLGFNETAEKIIQSVAENSWNMPAQYDLQATLGKHGFEVRPVRVFSVCKPEIANKILGGDQERVVSALMPCRIAIYEGKDGKTYVSRMNSPFFARFLGSKVKNPMVAAGAGVEMILDPVLKN
jgi:uncharacterized protein (DUF302 family)